jgi:hypothetical protein
MFAALAGKAGAIQPPDVASWLALVILKHRLAFRAQQKVFAANGGQTTARVIWQSLSLADTICREQMVNVWLRDDGGDAELAVPDHEGGEPVKLDWEMAGLLLACLFIGFGKVATARVLGSIEGAGERVEFEVAMQLAELVRAAGGNDGVPLAA